MRKFALVSRMLTPASYAIATRNATVSIAKAKRDLGYEPSDAELAAHGAMVAGLKDPLWLKG